MKHLPFIIPLVVSVWFHFVLFSFFIIKPIHRTGKIRYYPKVSFLGDVLPQGSGWDMRVGHRDGTSDPWMVPEVDLPKQREVLTSLQSLARKSHRIQAADVSKKRLSVFEVDGASDHLTAVSEHRRSRTYLSFEQEGNQKLGRDDSLFEIQHSLQYPDWARQRGIESKLKVAFQVNAEGEVDQVMIKQFSGYPQLDILGLNEVRGWKFVPLAAHEKQDQWGVVVIKFVLH